MLQYYLFMKSFPSEAYNFYCVKIASNEKRREKRMDDNKISNTNLKGQLHLKGSESSTD